MHCVNSYIVIIFHVAQKITKQNYSFNMLAGFQPSRIRMQILIRSGKARHVWWVVLVGLWGEGFLFGPGFPSLSCRKCFLFQRILLLCWEPGSKREPNPGGPPPRACSQRAALTFLTRASVIKEVIYTALFIFPTKNSVMLDSDRVPICAEVENKLHCVMHVYLLVFHYVVCRMLTLTVRRPWLGVLPDRSSISLHMHNLVEVKLSCPSYPDNTNPA